jgi:hypothetical protein
MEEDLCTLKQLVYFQFPIVRDCFDILVGETKKSRYIVFSKEKMENRFYCYQKNDVCSFLK